jgi:hypothetical protein
MKAKIQELDCKTQPLAMDGSAKASDDLDLDELFVVDILG